MVEIRLLFFTLLFLTASMAVAAGEEEKVKKTVRQIKITSHLGHVCDFDRCPG